MKIRSSVLVFYVVFAGHVLLAQSLPSELVNFNNAWMTARKAGDRRSLDQMTTDDFRFTDESGGVVNKTEFLRSAEPLTPDDQSRFEDLDIRLLGEDAALMFVRLVETNRSLRGITVEFREIKVFRRVSGSWKLAAIQVTQIAPQRESTPAPESTLRQYVGVYERSTNDYLNITFADGRLFGQRTGFQKREYIPMGEGIFYANSSAATYVFVRDERGAMQSIQLLVFGRVFNFKRVH